MQEHPIPQDITNYRFHIIGSMTLKQFAEVLAGVLVGVFIYSTNLPAIIKYPLILISVGLGAGAAFVPFEERPLDHWIVTFFRVLYKPTKFFWKRETKIPDVFFYQSNKNTTDNGPQLDFKPIKRRRIDEYLNTVKNRDVIEEFDYDSAELTRMQNILSDFNLPATLSTNNPNETTNITIFDEIDKPNLEVRVRSLRKQKDVTILEDQTYDPNLGVNDPNSQDYNPDFTLYANQLDQTSGQSQNADQQKNVANLEQVAQDIKIPEPTFVKVTEQLTTENMGVENTIINTDTNTQIYSTEQPQSQPLTTETATAYNADLPFPTPPTEPNKLVGMVLSKDGVNLLDNTIIEVQTLEGIIVRAVKTNPLGQFLITTPLANGEYIISAEKDNYQFQPTKIVLNNTVIPPIEIRSLN